MNGLLLKVRLYTVCMLKNILIKEAWHWRSFTDAVRHAWIMLEQTQMMTGSWHYSSGNTWMMKKQDFISKLQFIKKPRTMILQKPGQLGWIIQCSDERWGRRVTQTTWFNGKPLKMRKMSHYASWRRCRRHILTLCKSEMVFITVEANLNMVIPTRVAKQCLCGTWAVWSYYVSEKYYHQSFHWRISATIPFELAAQGNKNNSNVLDEYMGQSCPWINK